MLKNALNSQRFSGIFSEIESAIRGSQQTAVFGVSFVEKCRIVSSINEPLIYLVRDAQTANKVVDEVSAMSCQQAVYLPAKDDTLLFKSTFNKDNLYARLTALYQIKKGAKKIITTPEALLQLFPTSLKVLNYNVGSDYDMHKEAQNLINIGYKRVSMCEVKGEFSIRGDILEIFPINSTEIIRIDFFGDIVEKIRLLNGGTASQIDVVQATDVIIENLEVESIKQKLKTAYNKLGGVGVNDGAVNIYNRLLEKLESDLFDDSLFYLMPLIKSATHDFLSLTYADAVVLFDECKMICDQFGYLEKEHIERFNGLLKTKDGFDFIKDQFAPKDYVLSLLKGQRIASLQTLNTKISLFNPLKIFTVSATAVPRYFLKPDSLYQDLINWQLTGYTVLVTAPDKARAESIYFDITSHGLDATYLKEITDGIKGVCVAQLKLKLGFIQHDTKLVVIGNDDLFRKTQEKKIIKKRRGDLFTAPTVGEFAVHEHFGVGLIKGVKKIATVEGIKEYVELEYLGGDKLYVSTDQMDKLSKYLGGSETPTLNKIGGGEFERIKERVRQSIAKMTINLKRLYAQRKDKKGFEFSKDNPLMEEFENSFEYEETEDQIASISEIKEDMESAKVMDRLICGDVGFGKTEVAFRACFKAVLDAKQAAIVAPTTILTEQHYMTAIRRFSDFGVNVAVLNRFKTPAQQANILQKVEKGEIDIIIGTHRLFSKDVKFFDLGLLVIDEEQRFGVEHKEKLKLLKENVDTLTLTATPIPRTLHLSLSGIRDISTINTPPKQRIPVQTSVAELTDSLIKDALTREISRNGQVLILYNRVESIYEFAEQVSKLVPQAKIIVAHGQMPERALENSIDAFYKGEGNVLIATTIIENGIDMPRANTLIVTASDKMGLSTLYQLKGRVGRSNLMAYAYFTYAEGQILTDSAYKRLAALMEYTEMGSGYKIAMRDLEIRGAGNVLGKEQHGHMDKVGYELYNKLLKEQLGETTLNQEIELDVRADAYIPDEYIQSEKLRMDVYKQIAEIQTLQDRRRIENSLIENFGNPPKEVQTLIDIAWLKIKAEEADGVKIKISLNVAKLYLKNLESLKDGKITSKVVKYSKNVTLAFEDVPVLIFKGKTGNPIDSIILMTEFLTEG